MMFKFNKLLMILFCFLWVIGFHVSADPVEENWAEKNLNSETNAPPVWKITKDKTNNSLNSMGSKNSVKWKKYGKGRFSVYDNGTDILTDDLVLDHETGLIWARNANLAGTVQKWVESYEFNYAQKLGNRLGWRSPKVEEILSIIDPVNGMNYDHPFINIQNSGYWTVSTHESSVSYVYVALPNGDGTESDVSPFLKLGEKVTTSEQFNSWPVRGGTSSYGTET